MVLPTKLIRFIEKVVMHLRNGNYSEKEIYGRLYLEGERLLTDTKKEKKPFCGNCRHWNFNTTDKNRVAYGTCSHIENQQRKFNSALVDRYMNDEELKKEIISGILYPNKFGCVHFEKK